jgi:hypothetical protein
LERIWCDLLGKLVEARFRVGSSSKGKLEKSWYVDQRDAAAELGILSVPNASEEGEDHLFDTH